MKTRLPSFILTALCCLALAAPAARAQSGASLALQLDGVDDYAEALDRPGLNAFPFTVTAWIKTSQNTAGNAGIVGKFVIDSFNGYAMVLQNGMVWAAYYRDANSYLFSGRQWLNGGFIADGAWHHVAFVVESSGRAAVCRWRAARQLTLARDAGRLHDHCPAADRALRGLSGRAD